MKRKTNRNIKMNIDGARVNINLDKVLAEVNNYGTFIQLVFDCMAFPMKARNEIAEKLLNCSLEDEHETYNVSLIIPMDYSRPSENSAYIWANEWLGICDGLDDEITAYIRGECDLPNMTKVTTSPSNIFELLSPFDVFDMMKHS